VFTTPQSVQAEINYRQQHLTREFRRSARTTASRGRRHFHLFTRHTG
jgi:hypothetical protein